MGLRDMLTDKVTVEAPTRPGKDGAAAPTQAWAVVARNVPAQVTPLSAGQRIMAGISAMTISHQVLLVYPGIRQGQRLLDQESGVYLRVTGISRIPARGGIEAHWLVDLEEVKDGAP